MSAAGRHQESVKLHASIAPNKSEHHDPSPQSPLKTQGKTHQCLPSVTALPSTLDPTSPHGGAAGKMLPVKNLEAPELKENSQGEPHIRLSRSPHPYHRRPLRRETINCGLFPGSPRDQEQAQNGQLIETRPNTYNHAYYSGSHAISKEKQWKTSSSPSESGTEADDEGGGLLKGLPAPPLRLHKGLKEYANGEAPLTPSPQLTPLYTDKNERGFHNEASANKGWRGRNPAKEDELRSIRARLAQKRRGELRRRAVEILVVFAVGGISYPSAMFKTSMGRNGHETYHHSEDSIAYTEVAIAQLRIYGLVLGALYGFYLFRLLRSQFESLSPSNFYPFVHTAASFEPAPFLYPIMIPTFVAFSTFSTRPRFLLPNLILSICSIPPSMIPFSGYYPHLVQPLISLLPLLFVSRQDPNTPGGRMFMSSSSKRQVNGEILSLLPLIHQALVPSIDFLTTTSLLPAELQLLATSLINLLILSESPQAVVLKALLWIGGVSLYVTCRQVMKWAVAVSRIPSWRFRQSYHPSTKRAMLITAMDDCLGGRLGKWPQSQRADESSDEETKAMKSAGSRRKRLPAMSLSNFLKLDEPSLGLRKVMTNTSAGFENPRATYSNGRTRPPEPEPPRQRRHTLPTSLHDPPSKLDLEKVKSDFRRKARSSKNTRATTFLSLSRAQAEVLKWILACYVYAVVIAVIAFPVHWYIRTRSLVGHEPVGWALGYLFGDLPSFRLQTVLWNLESWICLPPREESTPDRVLAERIFIGYIGTANTRLVTSAYCVTVITLGLVAVLSLSPVVEVDTRRKVFHGMMVAMFLPAIFVDPTFAALALELILAIFLLLDLFRASQLPPLSKPLTYFLAPYVDGRDHRGPVIVSHIFLLVGCSIPLWLSLAATERTGHGAFHGWDVATRDLSMIAGVVCVGMGDAAASLFGRRYGRHRWPWSGGKSIEGSAAFAVAVVLGLGMARLWLLVGGWKGDGGDGWSLTLGKALVAASGASLTEAVLTGGNDNVIVPVVLWLLVRGLKM